MKGNTMNTDTNTNTNHGETIAGRFLSSFVKRNRKLLEYIALIGSAAIVFAMTDLAVNALTAKSPERASLERYIEAAYDSTMTLCLSLENTDMNAVEDLENCARWAERSVREIRKHRYNLKPL